MWFVAVRVKKELILKLTQYYIGGRYSHIIKMYLKVASVDLICRYRENTINKMKEDAICI